MSVNNESQNLAGGAVVEKHLPQGGVYASLFDKINLTPVAELGDLNGFDDTTVMAETSADARVTAAVKVFMQCLQKSGHKVEKLDKTILDHHIAELDFQIGRQLDEVMHHPDFQRTEGVWRGLKSLVDKTDFRQNVKLELLDLSKEELRQDFEDFPEIIQSGLYKQTYIAEYDTPGGEPIAAVTPNTTTSTLPTTRYALRSLCHDAILPVVSCRTKRSICWIPRAPACV